MSEADPNREAKAALRRAAAARRAGLAAEPGAAARLRALGLELLLPRAFATVSAYWPIRGEIDPVPLLAGLAAAGRRGALPVILGPGRPLEFRAWAPGEALARGVFGTSRPGEEALPVEPDLLLVPLLAFDRRRHRLGYGAGYYDMTLRRLRASRSVLAVGIAYAGQEVEAVPVDGWDEPLDLVLTDRGVI